MGRCGLYVPLSNSGFLLVSLQAKATMNPPWDPSVPNMAHDIQGNGLLMRWVDKGKPLGRGTWVCVKGM